MQAIGKTLSTQIQDAKKVAKKVTIGQPVKTVAHTTSTLKAIDKILQKQESLVQNKLKQTTRVKPSVKKEEEKPEIPVKITNVRRSLDLEKSDESSLYVSALDTLPEENAKRLSRTNKVS